MEKREMIRINPIAFKQNLRRMRFGSCQFNGPSSYWVFIYWVYFSIESEYGTCFSGEINNKKVIQLYSLSLFNTEETKTLIIIIAIYFMKMRITQPLGLG